MYDDDDLLCGEIAVVKESKPAATTPNRWEAMTFRVFSFIIGVLMGIQLAQVLRGVL